MNPQVSKTPPKTFQDGVSCIDSKRLLVLAYAIAKKTISEKTTPRLKKTAALKPLLTLISRIVKKTGPIVKDSINPKKTAGRNSLIIC